MEEELYDTIVILNPEKEKSLENGMVKIKNKQGCYKR